MRKRTLARILRTWRRKENLCQKEAAVKLGISRVYYDRLENGKGKPSLDLFLRILRSTQAPTDSVSINADRSNDEICELCQSLNRPDQDIVRKVIVAISKR